MILGDFGADVLRIDRPDQSLKTPNVMNSKWNLERLLHVSNCALNRNKKSIALNFKAEEGRQVFRQLAETADVIIEGFRPGIVKKLGIDYESLVEINPEVIYCSLSGFGQTGPYANLPGHDPTYTALGGALNMIGEANRKPVLPMNFIADMAGAALHGTIGILLALLAKNNTGKGQFIDISYTDSVASLNMPFAYDYLNYGTDYGRGNTPFNGLLPCIAVYETKDNKYISIGCLEPWFWENLCHFVGKDDFIAHEFDEGPMRQEMFAYLNNFFRTKTRDEWFDLMKDKNIPVGKVYSLDEVFQDPQLRHREMLQEINQPDGTREMTVGIAIKLLNTPGQIRKSAPVVGENTREVLLQIGYTDIQIEELKAKGTVGTVQN
jgi:crotonobetainyl-CoA:carnitine CoA-transferase CaiB-like acyl-CoA transferase